MHFEVPKAKTFKEFGGEYLMIVISILTALALESVVEKVHHDHLAREAGEQMGAELRADADDVKKTLAHNAQRSQALRTVQAQMLTELRAGGGDQAFLTRFQREWSKAVTMSLQTPSMRREAWETAVANQAVTWMPHAELEKFASAYAALRDMSAVLNGGAMNFLDGPRMHDVFSDVQMGVGNPRDLFRTVTQMISAYDSFDGNLQILNEELESALAEPKKLPQARPASGGGTSSR